MAGKKNSSKDSGMAAMLKKMGVERNSGACPWGCGAHVSNGGGPLVSHLGVCKGPSKGKRRVPTN
jgi:hypothetical protein